MRSRYWEKLWHEIIDDIKLGPLPAELKWRFVQLIVVAGMTGEGGVLPDLPDLAFRLRLTEEQLRSDLPTLARRELLELVNDNGRERWKLSGYEKRQSAMSSAERMQRMRSAESQSYPQAAPSSASASASYQSLQERKKKEEAEEEEDICDGSSQTCNNDVTTADLLAAAGISRNRTTAPLWNLDPTYIEAHLTAAKSSGLAIRKMLDGDPPPSTRRSELLKELDDIIIR